MTTRRAVLQAGMAMGALSVGSLALVNVRPPGRTQTAARCLPLYRVAYDGRYPAAQAFGERARELGGAVHDTRGDITALWYYELHDRWRRSASPVAGMTTFGSLLGLSMMASTAGLRVIYRGHHHLDVFPATHELFGSGTVLATVPPLPAGDRHWGRVVAELLMRWPASTTSVAPARSSILQADRRGVSLDSLVSWILAPSRRG